jgi:hypothetical protein
MWGRRNYSVLLLHPDDVSGIQSEPCGDLVQKKGVCLLTVTAVLTGLKVILVS